MAVVLQSFRGAMAAADAQPERNRSTTQESEDKAKRDAREVV